MKTTSKYETTKINYEQHAEQLYMLWKDSNLRSNIKIETFIHLLPLQAKILDVGAGFGKDMIYFINRGFNTIGVDTCKAFIEKARELYPNCQIIEMDFLDMGFEENEFDGVWSRGTLFHLTKGDFIKVIERIRKFLRPNGILYLQMMEGEFEGISNISTTTAVAWYSYYTAQELRGILSEYGFNFIHEIKIEGWMNHYYRLAKP